MKKNTVFDILKRKNKTPIVCLTSYSSPITEILDKYCDIILVGDSLATTLYGMSNTKKIDIKTMILHAQSVTRKTKKSLVVVDMPYKTYIDKFSAYENAKKIMKSSQCDAVKLEGGIKIFEIVNYLTKKGIPVMGHIGLLPQKEKSHFKVKGKNLKQRKKIIKDAIAIEKAGAFSIVIECVIEELAKEITNTIKIPTIGIGASKFCDGQILVIDDLIGLSNLNAKFVKKYANLKNIINDSVKKYCLDVKRRKFPKAQHTY